MASLLLSANEKSRTRTGDDQIDELLRGLHERSEAFARMPAREKAALLDRCLPKLAGVAERWVLAACEAKGIDPESPTAGEEWLGGPVTAIRNVRLLAASLRQVAERGAPPLGRGVVPRADGRLEVKVFPTGALDSVLFGAITATQLFPEGISEERIREQQASFYRQTDPTGGVSVVLGAGNVASIPPMDALYKSFVEGFTCIIKMNPVNEYLGPFFEEGFQPLFDAGFWRLAYGGAEVGARLVEHEAVSDVHITGSDRTHDIIVWGPPGDERERRKRENDPLLQKRITSELGNVTPVVVVPGTYADREMDALSESIASMVANNGSFNCNAAKLIVTSKGWPQRADLLERVRAFLNRIPPRRAYYPGARDRYDGLLHGRDVWYADEAREDGLRWALVADVDPSAADEALFRTEPFCAILSETRLDPVEPGAFLEAAVAFCNDRVWGRLSCTVVSPPCLMADKGYTASLEKAIVDLRYGTVALNHWSALGYGLVSCGWGGHPSSTLQDIQSGLGWVHNTYMLEGIEKTIVRAPLVIKPKPAWFASHRTAHRLGRKLVALEATGNWLKLPGIILEALCG